VVPPTEPCALRSTQPLKVSTRDFSWGKGGQCVWLTTYHPCSAETSRKSGALTNPEPLGSPRPVAGELYLFLHLKKTLLYNRQLVYSQFLQITTILYCKILCQLVGSHRVNSHVFSFYFTFKYCINVPTMTVNEQLNPVYTLK